MKAVIQRVKKASVTVDNKLTGSIEKGLLVLLGIHQHDTQKQLEWMADKILRLRIFNDGEDKMNRSVQDIKGAILVVSQFTLYGDAKKGTRPSYIEAARPDKAKPLYEEFIDYLENSSSLEIQTGVFAAYMDVELINDGPVTIILEK